MFIGSDFLNGLLCHDISGCEKDLAHRVSELGEAETSIALSTDSGGNALGQQRPLREPHLVPVDRELAIGW